MFQGQTSLLQSENRTNSSGADLVSLLEAATATTTATATAATPNPGVVNTPNNADRIKYLRAFLNCAYNNDADACTEKARLADVQHTVKRSPGLWNYQYWYPGHHKTSFDLHGSWGKKDDTSSFGADHEMGT